VLDDHRERPAWQPHDGPGRRRGSSCLARVAASAGLACGPVDEHALAAEAEVDEWHGDGFLPAQAGERRHPSPRPGTRGIRARAGLAEGVLPGSGAIVPIAHRTSVFDLTHAAWPRPRIYYSGQGWRCTICWPRTAICRVGARAVSYIPMCMSFHDSTANRRLTRAAVSDQRPGKQTARFTGAGERTGTPGCQVSEAPGVCLNQGRNPRPTIGADRRPAGALSAW
jgi:hypothetical protein